MENNIETAVVICLWIIFGYICGRMHQFGIDKKKDKTPKQKGVKR